MAKIRISEDARKAKAQTLAEQLYSTHHPRLLTIGRRNCPNLEDAEEALQDAFVLFINHFDPSSDAPPLAWLTLTLKRRCWACYRRQQFLRQIEKNKDSQTTAANKPEAIDYSHLPDELASIADDIVKTKKLLSQLKKDERRALSLLAIGYSYQDICSLTGWTYTKVNRCISEGRTRLREGDE